VRCWECRCCTTNRSCSHALLRRHKLCSLLQHQSDHKFCDASSRNLNPSHHGIVCKCIVQRPAKGSARKPFTPTTIYSWCRHRLSLLAAKHTRFGVHFSTITLNVAHRSSYSCALCLFFAIWFAQHKNTVMGGESFKKTDAGTVPSCDEQPAPHDKVFTCSHRQTDGLPFS
jgi:hypothetical protein